jgi:hypothetical protein
MLEVEKLADILLRISWLHPVEVLGIQRELW